jgi:hypothetical protein
MEPADPRRPTAVPDAAVRALSAGNGVGRIAIGVGLMLAPERALEVLGFPDAGPGAVVISRIAGVRDIILGVNTILALENQARLRAASLANAGADAGDALTFSLALGGESDSAAKRGIAAALPAALASLWAARRLSQGQI